jgi:acyl carrier protein
MELKIMSEIWSLSQIEEKVRQIVQDHLHVEPSDIRGDSLFVDDLGADSLDLTDLAIEFEDQFHIKIPEADLNRITTVSNVVEYLSVRLG